MTPTLLLLADGRFPAGAHAHSAGVESAVHAGDVTDVGTLDRYLRGRLATTGVTEAAFAAAAAGSALGGGADLVVLDAELDARVLSPRLRTISRRLGRQLHRAAIAAWPHPALHATHAVPGGAHQPLVLGAAVVAAGGAPADAAAIAVHHVANAVVTAGVRLLGLDPLAAAAVQADAVAWITPELSDAHAWAVAEPASLPGVTGTLAEILAEHHGTWDHRLFVA